MVVLVLCTQLPQLPKLTEGVINAVLNWEVVMMMIQDSTNSVCCSFVWFCSSFHCKQVESCLCFYV